MQNGLTHPLRQGLNKLGVVGMFFVVGAGPVAAPQQLSGAQFGLPQAGQLSGIAPGQPVCAAEFYVHRARA